jgi:hypothetical protein
LIIWIFLSAALLGVCLGWRFRAPAAAAASVVIAIVLALWAAVQAWSFGVSIGVIVATLTCLQCGFLAGLSLRRR